MKIIPNMTTGTTNVKYQRKAFGNFNPFPESASFTKLSQPQPYLVTQNKRYITDPIGRMLSLTMKSSRSNTPVPAPNG